MVAPITPSEVTPASYGDIAALLGLALSADPIAAALSGRQGQARVTFLSRGYHDLIMASRGVGSLWQVASAGVAAGALLFYEPGRYPLGGWRKLKLAARALRYGPRVIGRGLRYGRALDRHHPSAAHVYLAALGVAPGHQGRGIGSALVRHVLARADALGVGTYLETSNPSNLPFYQRHGLLVSATFSSLGVDNWCLWRPAVPQPSPW